MNKFKTLLIITFLIIQSELLFAYESGYCRCRSCHSKHDKPIYNLGRRNSLFRRKDNREPTTFQLNSEDFSSYVPPEVGLEIYVGLFAGIFPVAWASYEFWQRIETQRKCAVCNGSGLTNTTRLGANLSKLRKCWSCGGFLPWLGWKMFFLSSFIDVGNGGPLQRPAADYNEVNERIRQDKSSENKEN